jgi:hypothetical protein
MKFLQGIEEKRDKIQTQGIRQDLQVETLQEKLVKLRYNSVGIWDPLRA